jgi:hypothetical protein
LPNTLAKSVLEAVTVVLSRLWGWDRRRLSARQSERGDPIVHGEVDAPATASLSQDSGDMTLHRPVAQPEALADLGVGKTLLNEIDYLSLAFGHLRLRARLYQALARTGQRLIGTCTPTPNDYLLYMKYERGARFSLEAVGRSRTRSRREQCRRAIGPFGPGLHTRALCGDRTTAAHWPWLV